MDAKRAAREALVQQLQQQDAAARAALDLLRRGAPLEDAQKAAERALRNNRGWGAAGWLAGLKVRAESEAWRCLKLRAPWCWPQLWQFPMLAVLPAGCMYARKLWWLLTISLLAECAFADS